jgi:hypothetical protein
MTSHFLHAKDSAKKESNFLDLFILGFDSHLNHGYQYGVVIMEKLCCNNSAKKWMWLKHCSSTLQLPMIYKPFDIIIVGKWPKTG